MYGNIIQIIDISNTIKSRMYIIATNNNNAIMGRISGKFGFGII